MPQLQQADPYEEAALTTARTTIDLQSVVDDDIDLTRPLSALREVPQVVSLSEVQRYTGMAPERLRTWGRRYGFPLAVTGAGGKRGIAAEDLPAIVAVGQLVAAGLPVGDAVAEVRTGLPAPDLQGFERSFGRLTTPVVVLGGPQPLQIVWANAAARASGAGELLPPEPTARAYRAFQRMAIDFDGTAAVVSHPHWSDPERRMTSLAWTVGNPAARPPLVLAMAVGDEAVEAPESHRDDRDHVDARWASAIGRARRELQRGAGSSTVADSLCALIECSDAGDGFLVMTHGTDLRPTSSCRGERRAARLARGRWRELQQATDDLAPVWLGAELQTELGAGAGACLAMPLVARDRVKGFAVLQFGEQPDLSPDALELLMAWATAAASCQSRDAAAALRLRQLRGDG